MSDYRVKVLQVAPVTHNVHAFRVKKPTGFSYVPGQATELSLLKPGWEKEKRPFTFTSLPDSDYLEFTIKSYADHDGVTNQLRLVQPGDFFEIGDAWGTIQYKGEGVFLAGGAGVTPFIAILRHLHSQHKLGKNWLYFSNKTTQDIILRKEFEQMLGDQFFNVISKEPNTEFYHGQINQEFLENHIKDFKQPFYVCGPEGFISSILDTLKKLGAKPEALIFEQ